MPTKPKRQARATGSEKAQRRTRKSRAAKALALAREEFLETHPWCGSPAYANVVTAICRMQAYANEMAEKISTRGLLTAAGEPKRLLTDYLGLVEKLRTAEASLPPPPKEGLRPLLFSVNGAEGASVGELSDEQHQLVSAWVDRSQRMPSVDELDPVTTPVVHYYCGDLMAWAARLLCERVCALMDARPRDDAVLALLGAVDTLERAESGWSEHHPALDVARPSVPADPDAEQAAAEASVDAAAAISGEDATLADEQEVQDAADRQTAEQAELAALDTDEEEA